MAAKHSTLETGIDLYFGRPGSGKSYLATRRLLSSMEKERRPVYTNLPLRWRVLRTYLRNKGGEARAGLIHELTRASFIRFMERYAHERAWMEDRRAEDDKPTRKQAQREYFATFGERVTDGPEMNWIPATSLIIIDEVQHWFPNPSLPRAKKTPEPEVLQTYLTMHRHLQHKLWFLTQRERQISVTIRSLAQRIWDIHPRDDDAIVYNIRFKHLGLKCLGYLCYSADDWGSGKPEVGARPMESFSIYPGMPWNQLPFRFYDSYTHAGSKRELREALRAQRLGAGLDEAGDVVKVESEVDEVVKKPPLLFRMLAGSLKLCFRVTVVVCAVAIGGAIVAARDGKQTDQLIARLEEQETKLATLESVGAEAEGVTARPAFANMVCIGVYDEEIAFEGGGRLTPAGGIPGWRLLYTDPSEGAGIGLFRGYLWMFRVGERAERGASEAEVLARARAAGYGGAATFAAEAEADGN